MPGKSNEQLEKEHKSIKHTPEELKDTDVEDEFKEGNQKGFRKQTGTIASGSGSGEAATSTSPPSPPSTKDEKMKPEEFKDTDVEDEFKEGEQKGFRKNTGKARL